MSAPWIRPPLHLHPANAPSPPSPAALSPSSSCTSGLRQCASPRRLQPQPRLHRFTYVFLPISHACSCPDLSCCASSASPSAPLLLGPPQLRPPHGPLPCSIPQQSGHRQASSYSAPVRHLHHILCRCDALASSFPSVGHPTSPSLSPRRPLRLVPPVTASARAFSTGSLLPRPAAHRLHHHLGILRRALLPTSSLPSLSRITVPPPPSYSVPHMLVVPLHSLPRFLRRLRCRSCTTPTTSLLRREKLGALLCFHLLDSYLYQPFSLSLFFFTVIPSSSIVVSLT
jgi:hypothetical protein